jgi:hypothetical protein
MDVRVLERETGFEPATPTLARSCSTTELFPRPCRDGAISYHGHSGAEPQPSASRSAVAASSGATGLMKKPLPHSKPATRVSLGITSRCQWK